MMKNYLIMLNLLNQINQKYQHSILMRILSIYDEELFNNVESVKPDKTEVST